MPAIPEIYQRYLRVLGFDNVPFGFDGVRAVVRAHLLRVPFENVSKLLLYASEGLGRFFTLPEFLDGIEHQDMGGTCYGANPFLGDLLRALGYEADLHGANMPPRMNCHTSLRVRIDSHAYHVDVGYGGPFRDPIAFDRPPFVMVEGANRYVFDREPQGEQIKEARFRRQFAGKRLKDPITLGKDVDVISGASISSRSATYAARKALWLAEIARSRVTAENSK